MPKNYILTPDGNFCKENELRHWGIPGMKWGVRRFQNRDGSLTTAGKVRRDYGDGADELGSYARSGKSYVGKYLDRDITDFNTSFTLDTQMNQRRDYRRSIGDSDEPGLFAKKANGERADYFNTNSWFNMKYSDLASLYADKEDY